MTTTQQLAQSFSTGPGDAYNLDSVEVKVRTAPGTTSHISAAIHTEASGVPGTKVYDLSNPATIGTGAQKFTARAGATLNASTTYFVVLSTSSSTLHLAKTVWEDEDAGGADGWSIGNRSHFKSSGSWSTNVDAQQIRVNGYLTVLPTEVPFGWPLVPDALGDEGGEFRLLFLSSGESAATSTDIDTYNAFVQNAAASGHDAI